MIQPIVLTSINKRTSFHYTIKNITHETSYILYFSIPYIHILNQSFLVLCNPMEKDAIPRTLVKVIGESQAPKIVSTVI